MYVRASFCVSKVGMIVSSSGDGLALGVGVGASVCESPATAVARINDATHRLPGFPCIDLIRQKTALICGIWELINACAGSDERPRPAFGQFLPWTQFPPPSLSGGDSRNRIFVAANSS